MIGPAIEEIDKHLRDSVNDFYVDVSAFCDFIPSNISFIIKMPGVL